MTPKHLADIFKSLADLNKTLTDKVNGCNVVPEEILAKFNVLRDSVVTANLIGLQELCQVICTYIKELIVESRILSKKEYSILKNIPKNIDAYLKDPTKEACIECLLTELPVVFTAQESALLKNILMASSASVKNQIYQEHAKNEVFKQITSLLEQVNSCPKKWSEIGQLLVKFGTFFLSEGNITLQTMCLHLSQNCQKGAQQGSLSENQRVLLSHWLQLMRDYLLTYDIYHVIALLENLKTRGWWLPLTNKKAIAIIDQLQDKGDLTVSLSKQNKTATLRNLQEFAKVLESLKGDKETDLSSLIYILKKVSLLSAYRSLSDFQDICDFWLRYLEAASQNNQKLSSEQLDVLSTWTTFAEEIVIEPTNSKIKGKLVNTILHKCWGHEFSDTEIKLFEKFMFSNGRLEVLSKPYQQKTISSKKKIYHISQNLATVLHKEITGIHQQAISALKEDDRSSRDLLVEQANKLKCFLEICESNGIIGLYQVGRFLYLNLNDFQKEDIQFIKDIDDLLARCLDRIAAYLLSPGDLEISQNIVEITTAKSWLKPMSIEVSNRILGLLTELHLTSAIEANQLLEHTRDPHKDNTALLISNDIDEEVRLAFLQELPDQIEQLSIAVQKMISTESDIGSIKTAQRLAHTIKGSASIANVYELVSLTHNLEDIFSILNERGTTPKAPFLAQILVSASDCLFDISEALLQKGPAPSNIEGVVQGLSDWLKELKKDKNSEKNPSDLSAGTVSHQFLEISENPEKQKMLRLSSRHIDILLDLFGKTMLVNSELSEIVKLLIEQNKELSQKAVEFQLLISDFYHEIDNTKKDLRAANTITSKVQDEFQVDKYIEIDALAYQLSENINDIVELNKGTNLYLKSLEEASSRHSKMNLDAYKEVLKMRMVPIDSIAARLRRTVRQTSQQLKKNVELDLRGTNIRVDSDILNNLVVALLHILRNAVDHGVESKYSRSILGKSPTAEIKMTFSRVGTHLIVDYLDDGRGLDISRIREQAIMKGMIKKEDVIDDRIIQNIITKSGFSTCREITQTSGRGIGLDVVHNVVSAANGSMHISSKIGHGCSIRLRLPITLATIGIFIVSDNEQQFTVASYGVERISLLEDFKKSTRKNGATNTIPDDIEIINLATLLGMSLVNHSRHAEKKNKYVFIVQTDGRRVLVCVDNIQSHKYLPIKPMGKYLKYTHGVMGTVILGDGSVSAILELPELLSYCDHDKDRTDIIKMDLPVQNLPLVMIVDDSLSARQALEQAVADAGYDTVLAKNGMEAVQLLKHQIPDVVLTDLEMPVMNGLQFASYMSSYEETKDVPIIMISSKLNSKYKQAADREGVKCYMCKPFLVDELLLKIQNLLAKSDKSGLIH